MATKKSTKIAMEFTVADLDLIAAALPHMARELHNTAMAGKWPHGEKLTESDVDTLNKNHKRLYQLYDKIKKQTKDK